MQAKTRRSLVEQSVREFESVELGDPRREARVLMVAGSLAGRPNKSFPKALGTEAELQGGYRLMRNPDVHWQDLLEPHVELTVERCRAAGLILAVHDTTTMTFKGDGREEELGEVENGALGFFLHTSLAVSGDNLRRPLGVLGLHPNIREEKPKVSKSAQVTRSRELAQEDKESDRWRVAALEAQQRFGAETNVIHVMDRESDSFPLMAALQGGGCRFVLRAKHDRVLEGGEKLWASMEVIKGEALREVPLSERKRINRKSAQPARNARLASLHFRARTVELPRPPAAQTSVERLKLQVLHVYEPNPPEGQPAVEWMLLTTEPVTSLEQALQVIDWYRARWVIEEYFKALKTGCAYEKRQLEALGTLLNALALLAPVAWALLRLRSIARENPDAPASNIFSLAELRLLAALSVRVKLGKNPTTHEAMLAIAGLGGHLKRNGEPGWQTLGEGFLEFLTAQRTMTAARRANL